MISKFSLLASLCIGALLITPAAHAAKRHKKKAALVRVAKAAEWPPGRPYAERNEVLQQADALARRRELDRDWVRQVLGQARYLPQVAKLIQPPPVGTPKDWQTYRKRFIEPIRIKAGVTFWQANRDTLARAEKETGVSAEVIVGILGIETLYGQHMGTYRVIDALATLAFDFPPNHPRASERSAFFLSELEQFLTLSRRGDGDPLAPLGSYAGAMGMPQFMPSSWLRYALDYDGDGKIDLHHSAADAIGSVANYFKAFGWHPGMPTHYPVSFDADKLDLPSLLAPDILPTFSVARLQEKGVLLEGNALRHSGPLALVELQNGSAAPSYVVGTENFYVITRYNWSSYYALAVIELGQAVAAALDK